MSSRERRYRRTLRLLPAGYRQLWEAEMVNAYLESEGSHAPAEHLSVVRLALRLRLAGTHLTPRGQAWRGALHAVLLVALGYLAAGPVVNLAYGLSGVAWASWLDLTALGPISALLWVATFVTAVVDRARATRVLAPLAFVASSTAQLTALREIDHPLGAVVAPLMAVDIMWLAVVTLLAVLVPAADPPLSRRARSLWFGGAVLLALIVVPVQPVINNLPWGARADPWLNRAFIYVTPENAMHLGLLVAMVLALARWRAPRALLGLALLVVVIVGRDLVGYAVYQWGNHGVFIDSSPLSYVQRFDVALVALAVACAIVGLRRLPRPAASAAPRRLA